nr:hypothetical protein [Fusarium asiaticum vivivirus 1]
MEPRPLVVNGDPSNPYGFVNGLSYRGGGGGRVPHLNASCAPRTYSNAETRFYPMPSRPSSLCADAAGSSGFGYVPLSVAGDVYGGLAGLMRRGGPVSAGIGIEQRVAAERYAEGLREAKPFGEVKHMEGIKTVVLRLNRVFAFGETAEGCFEYVVPSSAVGVKFGGRGIGSYVKVPVTYTGKIDMRTGVLLGRIDEYGRYVCGTRADVAYGTQFVRIGDYVERLERKHAARLVPVSKSVVKPSAEPVVVAPKPLVSCATVAALEAAVVVSRDVVASDLTAPGGEGESVAPRAKFGKFEALFDDDADSDAPVVEHVEEGEAPVSVARGVPFEPYSSMGGGSLKKRDVLYLRDKAPDGAVGECIEVASSS